MGYVILITEHLFYHGAGVRAMKERSYIAIDLKSFYASVECRERGLDPLDTLLVVADEGRTDKTICLAVTPSLKNYGIPGRARLFEVKEKVREANALRKYKAPGKKFSGKSHFYSELSKNPALELDFIIAPPRMAYYMKYSSQIYEIYLKYVSKQDIIVYSIDEVFMDVTNYLSTYGLSAKELAMKMILDVINETGITATAGIGTNLYLCKIAMDILAKHIPADENGVRIAFLNEQEYREKMWGHRPITDFWRVGKGYADKLAQKYIYTMGDVARCSIEDEDLLYRMFGKNAELLIDHAWGYEPTTVETVKKYRPRTNSISSGQVLHVPYKADKARLVLREMADLLALDLLDKGLVTNQMVVSIGYDIENLTDENRRRNYKGEIVTDTYGRQIPKHAHGTYNFTEYSSSSALFQKGSGELFDRIINPELTVRRLTIVAANVISEKDVPKKEPLQLDLFTDYSALKKEEESKNAFLQKERQEQSAILEIKKRFGKNAIMKGMNLEEGATAKDRNAQIGGHKA